MTKKEFSIIAQSIPVLPGVYKYYNSNNDIIYVGKAKHLRKRINSYFSNTITNQKTTELVKRIQRIEFTIVNNEQDAFFLENSLIKEHQPVYNIQLKDDKGYPYLVLKNEPFSRVFFTRKKITDGSQYFGPYTSVNNVRDLLDFIKQHIPLRNCKLNLSDSNIQKKKFKVCLEYHLGNCKGPCEGFQTLENYNEGLDHIKHLLKGNLSPILQEYKIRIKKHVEKMEFEKAAHYKTKVEQLQQYQSKSTVVNTKTGTVDVFTIFADNDLAYINYLAVTNGTIIQTKTIQIEKKLDEPKEEILIFAIAQLRNTFKSEAREIVIPFRLSYPDKEIIVTVPKLGDKKKLLELSEKNVNYFKSEILLKKSLNLKKQTAGETSDILKQLQIDLHLSEYPEHIECFDNSNLQGSHPVAAMVCFKNGLPSKTDYRHYNIQTVKGINDFASMHEVVFRRYKRLSEEKLPMPQLIIIDGGKGQLSAALEAIHTLGLSGKTTLVGLAKNQEELFFAGDTASLQLPWNSDSLKLIRYIRDEVHRFGISFHRNKRSLAALQNELEMIPGIGKQTAELLLKKFKSVKKIKELTLGTLKDEIGIAKASIVFDYFHNGNANKT